jgi:hypothetical protein
MIFILACCSVCGPDRQTHTREQRDTPDTDTPVGAAVDPGALQLAEGDACKVSDLVVGADCLCVALRLLNCQRHQMWLVLLPKDVGVCWCVRGLRVWLRQRPDDQDHSCGSCAQL